MFCSSQKPYNSDENKIYRGWRITTLAANSVGVQPSSGLRRGGDAFLPRAALRLHGVINVSPLRGRERVAFYQNHSMKDLFMNWKC